MATVLLPLTPGTLPAGVCYGTEQARLNGFAENLFARLDGSAIYSFGDTKPAPEFNAYPWLRSTDMRWYRFDGNWISPNPETSAFVRRLFTGTTIDLQTYDGGDAGVPSDRGGPMWEVDADFAARFLVAPGTFAASGAVAVGGIGGADKVTLTQAELPPILNGITNNWSNTNYDPTTLRLLADDHSENSGTIDASITLNNPAGGQPHNNLPPYRGVYLIKRVLTRLFYAVP